MALELDQAGSRATQEPLAAASAPSEAEGEAEPSERSYLGVVKSYNDRRGFGFVACTEMVARHGRDVYLPKTEAALASAAAGEKMGEGDVLQFRVRLSTEGYPQAAEVTRLRLLRGVVVRPPTADAAGLIRSSDLAEARDCEELEVAPETVGQLRLAEGDDVSFCVAEGSDEAQLVCLEKTARAAAAVLGLCSVRLPREGERPDATLQLHAFSDRVVATGLPADVTEVELTHFFGKQGATAVTLARSSGGASFAAALFPSVREVSRLLGSPVHAFADDIETRVGAVLPAAEEQPALPALPRPSLAAEKEQGALLISWAPAAIADSYAVELRTAGSQGAWSPVEDATDNTRRTECSSCRVTGLPTTTAFEARISYVASCGTRSEPSDASEPCVAVPPSPPPRPATLQLQASISAPAPAVAWTTPGIMASAPAAAMPAAMPGAMPGGMPGAMPGVMPGTVAMPCTMPGVMPSGVPAGMVGGAAPQQMQELAAAMSLAQVAQPIGMPTVMAAAPGWQCAAGSAVPLAPAPEVTWADEAGTSVLVQWAPVANATSYVVELHEAGGAACERFPRPAAPAVPGRPLDLQIGGLRPPAIGCRYVAQVRYSDASGCESAPSAPAWTLPWAQPLVGDALPRLLQAAQPALQAPIVQQPEVAKAEQATLMPAGAQAPWFGALQTAGGLVVQAAMPNVTVGPDGNFIMLD